MLGIWLRALSKFHGKELRKGRYSQVGQVYVVTSVTDQRIRIFEDLYLGRLLVNELKSCDTHEFCETWAWVVMPDHFHWLFELKKETLEKLMQRVKSKSARIINKHRGKSDQVWQRGYHDRAIRQDEDVDSIARYIVTNPLRAGLVKNVRNYSLWDARWL